jgi:predicted flap endonuclease-1-like 5' DNA nuclease
MLFSTADILRDESRERKDDEMKVLRVFFVGLVFGWLMRWVLDKIYLEENLRSVANENDLLRQRLQTLEAARLQKNRSMQMPEPAPLPVEDVEPVAVTGSGPVAPHRDDLKMIKGVGPQIEKKLNTAGVYTFDQMSRLTTEQLQMVLGGSRRNAQSIDNMINQAKDYADQGPKG